MYSDLRCLTVELPEDIAKLKWFGDFERAKKVIHMRLQKDLPVMLKKRLELELSILDLMPQQYPYSHSEALTLLKENIKDFEDEELEQLRDEDAVEWIYINGQVHFKDNFLENLMKTRPYLEARAIHPNPEKNASAKLLNATMKKMKEYGSLSYRYHMKSTLKIKPEAERIGETVKVHLPVPVEYAQVKNFRLLSTSPEFKMIAPADYPQRTVYFETKLHKDQEFTVEYEFENHMTYVDPKPEEVLDAQPTFYTEEQLPHVKFTPYMKSLVAEVIGNETNPLIKAHKIYDYITSHVMYSFVRSYFTITDIPGYMATGFKGDCGIQALLFITMCRIAGVPARWQAGLYNSPLSVGNHDWAQFYVAPYGWLYADCSFGGSAYRSQAFERRDFYFGNLDPFRIPANSEFQHELMPPKKFLRNDPYDNQSGEVEYEDCGLYLETYETVHEIVSMEELTE